MKKQTIYTAAQRHHQYQKYMNDKYMYTDIEDYLSLFPQKPAKAITVKQPYAVLVAAGAIDIINSPFKTNYRGPVYIHAARQIDDNPTFTPQQRKSPVVDIMLRYDDWATSAIVGCAEIVDCVRNHPSKWAEKSKWNYVLKNAAFFHSSVNNISGHSMLWNYTGPTPSGKGYVLKSIIAKIAGTRKEDKKPDILGETLAEAAHSTTDALEHELSYEMQLKAFFTPLIISELIWHYAFAAADLAVRHKVSFLRPVTRRLKELRQEYEQSLQKDLSPSKMQALARRTQQILDNRQQQLYMLHINICQEFKRTAPNYPCEDLRVNAMTAVMLVQLLEDYYAYVNRDILSLVQTKQVPFSVVSVQQRRLQKLCRAMAAVEGAFNEQNPSIVACLNALQNKFRAEAITYYQ